MGYNPSIRSVVRVEDHLRAMKESSTDLEWTPPAGVTPFQLAFWIREGIRAAAHHVAYKKYANLLDSYTIRQRPKTVKAEVKLSRLEVLTSELNTITLPDPTDPLEIIGAAIKHKGNKMFFPNGVPDVSLFNWSKRNGYFIVFGDDGLTLTKDDVGDIAWRPESL